MENATINLMKPDINALVLYKGQPAIIISKEVDKFEIVLENGSRRVREKDFTVLSPGPVSRLADVLNKSAPETDYAEAADFFSDEETNFTQITELLWGQLSPEYSWALWQAISSSPWFVCTTPDQMITVRSREQAEAIIRIAEQRAGEEAERIAFSTRLKNTYAGKSSGIQRPDDDRFLQEIEALALGSTVKSKALSRAGLAETPQLAHSILLSCGYWNDDRNPWPYRHGLSLSTPQIPIDPPDIHANRLDLTSLESWAIDNDWSADPDDAISYDNGVLWVHVADPAETVTPDSPADIAARARGSTLYIPEGASRMLSNLALEYYGLGLSDMSCALSFRIELENNGSIADVSVHRTIISVTRKTYQEVSAAAESPQFIHFFTLANRNISRRIAAGAVSIALPEVHVSVDPSKPLKEQVSISPIDSLPAAEMVREMMLIAGEAAARFAFKNRIPFQYVSQDKSDIPSSLPEGLAGEYRKRRSMRGRKVGTVPADHAGLGLGMYAQVTSPLRRYGDLVVHQQLHRFLEGAPLMDTDDMLMRIAAGDAAARECSLAERESNLHWKLVYLSRNSDWRGKGIVVELNASNATILVPDLGIEDRITLPESNLNDNIDLSVSGVSLHDQRINFTRK